MPIFFRAERNINAGEELLWNYGQEGKGMHACPCDLCFGQCGCAECKGKKFHGDQNTEDTNKKIIDCYVGIDGNFKVTKMTSRATSRLLYRDLEGKQLYNDITDSKDNIEKMVIFSFFLYFIFSKNVFVFLMEIIIFR